MVDLLAPLLYGGAMSGLVNIFAADEADMEPSPPKDYLPLRAQSEVVGFPQTLPIELALRVAPEADILAAYNISEREYAWLCQSPAFVAALRNAHEMVQRDGMSFKLKARLQAEELLKESWRLVHDRELPPSVRADLIKATVRWSGYDNPSSADTGQTVNPIQININLG